MKYIIKDTNEEIKFGETIETTHMVDTIFGTVEAFFKTTLTEDNVDTFVKEGILTVVEDTPEPLKPVGYYLAKYCKRLGWDIKRFTNSFADICSVNPAPLFIALLKEIAIDMDKKYDGHISECDSHYVVSPVDGGVHKAKGLNNFRNISAFRTAEDAISALLILKEIHQEMFPELYGESEDKKCNSEGV